MIELLVVIGIVSLTTVFVLAHGQHRDSSGGPWRVAFVLEQSGEYRELYSEEAAELRGLQGKLSRDKLIALRGALKDKYQAVTPPEVDAALRVAVGERYEKRIPTGEFNPGSTSQAINVAGQIFKYTGRVMIVLMLYSEYQKVIAADNWDEQLGSSASGFIGSVAMGGVGAEIVGGSLGALGANPATIAVGAAAGGVVGGILGYDLFSGAFDDLWDIVYPEE